MKVWLDDERDPSNKFFCADGGFIWVQTANEAIELLKTGKVTEISLDHDLGDGQDGIAVAKFIEHAAFAGTIPQLRVRFHTMNEVGRRNMQAAIRQAILYWRENEIN